MRRFSTAIIALLVLISAAQYVATPAQAAEPIPASLGGSGGYEMFVKGNADMEAVYPLIVDAASKMVSKIKLPTGIDYDIDEIHACLRAVFSDYPQFFWLHEDVEMTMIGSAYYISWDQRFNDKSVVSETAEITAAKVALDNKIEEIVKDAPSGDYEISLFLHDWLIENVDTDLSAKNQSNAYGAIVEGRATCLGYAQAYTLLMNRLGVKTWTVDGIARDGGESHAWNMVWFGDKCVFTDVTWDDSEYFAYYYFNRSGKQINKDHSLYSDQGIAICSHTGYEYKGSIPVTKILPPAVTSAQKTGTRISIKCGFYPRDATETDFVLTSSNPEVAAIVNGKVIAYKAGEAVITISTKDGKVSADLKLTFEGKPYNPNSGGGGSKDPTISTTAPTEPSLPTQPPQETVPPATAAPTVPSNTEEPTVTTTVPEVPEADAKETLDPEVIWFGVGLFVAGAGFAFLLTVIHRRKRS